MLATQTTTGTNLAPPHSTWSLPVKGDAGSAHPEHAVETDLLTPPFTRPSSPSPARAQASERYAPPSTAFLNPQDYPRRQLTPAVGLRFEPQFQIKDILDLPEGDAKREALLKELAYTSKSGTDYAGNRYCTKELTLNV